MKRMLLSLVPVAVMVAAVTVTPASAAPQAAEDIVFDGYCDGLHLNIPSIGLPTTEFSVDGDQTGCVTGGVIGLAKPDFQGRYGVTRGREFVSIPGFGTHTVINRNHTWIHYALSGNTIYVLNHGTWSLGTPRAGAGTPSAIPRAGVVSVGQRSAALERVRNIAFDGYCDGMELVSPSAGTGKGGTVDGHRTGCVFDGLMGSASAIGQAGDSVVVSFFADGVQWLETAIFPDYTWVHYGVSGNTIFVLNSGTWSPGPPLGVGAASSTR